MLQLAPFTVENQVKECSCCAVALDEDSEYYLIQDRKGTVQIIVCLICADEALCRKQPV